MPAFNREKTIVRAIRSVLEQSVPDLEIVVVDDGSTDGTVAAVESVDDPRVRLIRHEVNGGEAAGRNTGVRAARGRYVAYLDSDDEWLPGKLAAQLEVLEGAPDPVRGCICGIELVADGEAYPRIPHLSRPLEKLLLMGCGLFPGATLLVRRDVFDEVGYYDTALPRFTDWDWLLRYAERYELVLVPKPLARVYRDGNPTGESVENSTRHLLSKHGDRFAKYGHGTERKALAVRWSEVAHHYFRDRDFRNGSRYLVRAFLETPVQRLGMYVLLVDTLFGVPLQRFLWRVMRGLKGG